MKHDCITNSVIKATTQIGVNTYKRERVCKICSTIWGTIETRKRMSTTSTEDEKARADQILENICSIFSITKEQLIGKERPKRLAYPRHVAMYLCKEAGYSYSAIGRVFGRNHAGVIYGYRNIARRMENDIETRKLIRLAQQHMEAQDFSRLKQST